MKKRIHQEKQIALHRYITSRLEFLESIRTQNLFKEKFERAGAVLQRLDPATYLRETENADMERYIANPNFVIKKWDITVEVVEKEANDGCEDCAICYQKTNERFSATLNCNHQFCVCCLTEQFDRHNANTSPNCGYCRTPVTNVKVSNDMIKKQMFAQFTRA